MGSLVSWRGAVRILATVIIEMSEIVVTYYIRSNNRNSNNTKKKQNYQ